MCRTLSGRYHGLEMVPDTHTCTSEMREVDFFFTLDFEAVERCQWVGFVVQLHHHRSQRICVGIDAELQHRFMTVSMLMRRGISELWRTELPNEKADVRVRVGADPEGMTKVKLVYHI